MILEHTKFHLKIIIDKMAFCCINLYISSFYIVIMRKITKQGYFDPITYAIFTIILVLMIIWLIKGTGG